MSRRLPFAAAVATLAAGCVHPGKTAPADTPLKKAVRFVEVDNRDRKFDLSGSGLVDEALLDAKAPATRVPSGRFVDMDSTLAIKIDRDALTEQAAPALSAARAAELTAKKTRVENAIVALGAVVDARIAAVDAYRRLVERKRDGGDPAAARAEFRTRRRAFGAAENGLITTLRQEWASDADTFARLDEAAADPTYARLQAVLQQEVDRIDAEHRAIAAAIDASALHLRLTAFLQSGDKKVQVHLPGYDDLDDGVVQRRDRLGLDLSAEEVRRLDDQWSKTVALAAAAEELRAKKLSLRDALAKVGAVVAPQFSEALASASAVHDSIASADLPAMVAELKADLREVARAIDDPQLELDAELRGRGAEIARQWRERVESVDGVARAVAEIDRIADEWRTARPADMVPLVLRTAAEVGSAIELLGTLPGSFEAGRTALAEIVRDEVHGITDAAVSRITDHLPAATVARLGQRLQQLRKLWAEVRAAVEALATVVDGFDVVPVRGDVEPPVARRIPLTAITDSEVDLELTPRLRGDSVVVHAALFRGNAEQPFDEVKGRFETEYFGWHARLSPSVALVRPTRLAGAQESFAFAPVLSWMHSYRPRPEHTELLDGFARALEPAVGVHAAFVNFDPDKEVEIGLGLTVSFWQDRLQAGVGANLMADSERDGGFYFFIASDLISLLNTIGIGK